MQRERIEPPRVSKLFLGGENAAYRLLTFSLGLVTLAAGFLIPIHFTCCFVPSARLSF